MLVRVSAWALVNPACSPDHIFSRVGTTVAPLRSSSAARLDTSDSLTRARVIVGTGTSYFLGGGGGMNRRISPSPVPLLTSGTSTGNPPVDVTVTAACAAANVAPFPPPPELATRAMNMLREPCPPISSVVHLFASEWDRGDPLFVRLEKDRLDYLGVLTRLLGHCRSSGSFAGSLAQ